jgi:20S proteasome subunit beta 4
VLVAADASVAQSIVKFKEDEDKILTIDDDKLLSIGGPVSDRNVFGQFIKNNIHLYKFKHGFKLNTAESAGIYFIQDFIRSELARAIREAP